MAVIRPFKSIRPRVDLVGKIAALPYDVYNREEAKEEIQREPMSFLRIDRAETQFDDSVDMYAPCVYERARKTLDSMIKAGYFVTEGRPGYYVYELTMAGRSQTGIVACASIDDYENNIIKKHENTRADKEVDRIHHVDTCDAQTGPIFLAYRSNEVINKIVEETKKKKPIYNFISQDGIRHVVWIINNEKEMTTLKTAFANINSIYIADGHHRAASAVKVGQMRRKENMGYTGEEEFNYFLSVLFPHDQLMIMDYNRVVADLAGHTKEEFLKLAAEKFRIEETGKKAYHPERKGTFGMYLDKSWYKLIARDEVISEDPVDGLDVSILQNELLGPLLHIDDPRTDKRIEFVGGIRGLGELKHRVETDMEVAFALYPTSILELFAVSDAGRLMPPKSTWFEPKLRSGIFIHKLS